MRLAVLLGPLGVVWSCGAPTGPPDPGPVVSSTGTDAIQQLAGCFDVTWRFVEDGVHDMFSEDYGLASPAKEWVGLRRTGEETFQFQHALFIGARPLAHWYEVWTQQPGTDDWRQEVWGGTPGPESERAVRVYSSVGRQSLGMPRRTGREATARRESRLRLARPNKHPAGDARWVCAEPETTARCGKRVMSRRRSLGGPPMFRLDDQQCAPATERFPKELLGPGEVIGEVRQAETTGKGKPSLPPPARGQINCDTPG